MTHPENTTPANPAQVTDALDGFSQYRRKQIAELRPWVSGDDMSRVSVSAPDQEAGSPKTGDMIARNPKNHDDQWLVAAAYFADNFEPLTAAIGAGGQAVAWQYTAIIDDDGTERRERRIATNPDFVADLDPVAREIVPLYPHPAPSGQAAVEDWQRIDDALVSCAGLLRTLCKDEIGDTAATELEYVRSALSNPPAQPGWREAVQDLLDVIDKVQSKPSHESIYGIYNPDSPMAAKVERVRAMLSASTLPGGA